MIAFFRNIIFVSLFSCAITAMAGDYQATAYQCQGAGSTLTFKLDGALGLSLFSYIDTKTIWLASAVNVHNLTYQVSVSLASGIASGVNPAEADVVQYVRFTLPQDRLVRRVQTNGYYFPVYTVYPAKFSLEMTVQSPRQKMTERLFCEGT